MLIKNWLKVTQVYRKYLKIFYANSTHKQVNASVFTELIIRIVSAFTNDVIHIIIAKASTSRQENSGFCISNGRFQFWNRRYESPNYLASTTKSMLQQSILRHLRPPLIVKEHYNIANFRFYQLGK